MQDILNNESSLDLFYTVNDLADSFVIVLDVNFQILYINKYAAKTFGEGSKGKNIDKLCNEKNLISPMNSITKEESFSSVKLLLKPDKKDQVIWKIKKINLSTQQRDSWVLWGDLQSEEAPLSDEEISLSKVIDTIMDNLPGNFYWKDKFGTYVGCNKQLLETTGLEKKTNIIGKTDYDLWPSEADQMRKNDRLAMEKKEPVNLEESVEIDGEPRWFAAIKVPLLDSQNRVIGVLGNSVDITFEKKAKRLIEKAKEQAEAANQAKSEFLAMMTHELRTPLNVVLGMTQLMRREEVTEEEKADYLATIMRSGQSLLGLINDILDFSKAQSGKLQVREEPFELDGLLDQLKREFQVKGGEHGVEYRIERDEQLPQYLLADEQRLRQIIYNLSDNAMKFTHEGTVTVNLKRIEAKNKDRVGLQIDVQDTGIGIPEEKLKSVFEEFTQVSSKKHDEYSRRYGGVGLGLAIVKQLVELMGGHIDVASKLGEGTTFTCCFEFQEPAEKQIKQLQIDERSKAELESGHSRKLSILLVEDNLLNQKVARSMLERLHCEVDVANDASEALVKLRSSYDLVLMDMSLPEMSGLEATREFRKKEAASQHQPIVAVTANVHADDKRACLASGMDDFLTKPIMLDELKRLIQRYRH